jgi:hypothetical protein
MRKRCAAKQFDHIPNFLKITNQPLEEAEDV